MSEKIKMALPFAVCAVVFGVLSYLHPYWLDTMWFTADYHGICEEEGGATLHAFLSYFRYESSTDNARIFNRLAPLIFDYLPKWADAAGVGFMTGLLFWSLGRLIGLGRGDGVLGWGLLAMMFICLPWSNNIFVPVYSLNYIYPAACSLLAVYLSLQRSALGIAGAFVLAVAGAWGHEGIGGLLMAGAVPMMLTVKKYGRYKWLYGVSAAATATGAAAFFCTHLVLRLGHELARAWMCADPLRWLMFNFFTVALVLLCVACVCRRIWRQRLVALVARHPEVVYFFFLAVAGAVLSGMMHRSYRITLWPQLCSMVVWGIVLLPAMRRYIKILRRVIWCVASLCTVLFCGEVYVGIQYNRAVGDAYKQFDNPASNTAYVKFLHPRKYPAWITRFAPRYIFLDYSKDHYLSMYLGRKVSIVPEELRGVDTSIPVDSIVMQRGGVGYFRSSQETEIQFNIYGDVATPNGVRHNEPIALINFSGDDGTPLVWVQPLYIVPEDVLEVAADVSVIYTDNDFRDDDR